MAVLVLGSAALAWTPTRHGLNDRRHNVMDMREARCIWTWPLKPLPENMTAELKKKKWMGWGRVKERTIAKGWKCGPEGIIRKVFPDHAEDQALRVAGCESTGIPYHLNPYAKNPSSSASGLFQLLDTWWAGKFDPFDAGPNTRMAYQLWLGSGGSFARHWAASIGCWG